MSADKIDIEDLFRKIAHSLREDFEVTKASKHKGITGKNREDIVKRFLRNNLPDNVGIGDVEVFQKQS